MPLLFQEWYFLLHREGTGRVKGGGGPRWAYLAAAAGQEKTAQESGVGLSQTGL